MKSLFIPTLLLLGAAKAHGIEMPTMSCAFDTFIGVRHEAPAETKRTPIQQSIKIVAGKTDEATLRLDGAKRATNSRVWKALPIEGWDTWETTFVGDFRELLTLAHDLGANNKALHGSYKATLLSTRLESTQIFLGTCLVR